MNGLLQYSLSFVLNEHADVNVIHVGNESTPIIIIDALYKNPNELIEFANDGKSFSQGSDFYPGIRKALPNEYAKGICNRYLSLLQKVYQLPSIVTAKVVLSALSIANTPPEKLRPIQTLPHFDSTHAHQFAVVHYLCDEQHGGTSFYRHKKTNFETITESRLVNYGTLLKQQAINEQLHKKLSYIEGDTPLFSRIYKIEAKLNRAIIYPSNLLHSGNINVTTGLSSDPVLGRLTSSSFIRMQ